MNTERHIMLLEDCINRYVPGVKIFRDVYADKIEVWFPKDPQISKAERAVDEAWERAT